VRGKPAERLDPVGHPNIAGLMPCGTEVHSKILSSMMCSMRQQAGTCSTTIIQKNNNPRYKI
jgi:hypothetical protein